MYGPPPDPSQVAVPASFAEAPVAWVACIALGLAGAWFAGLKRPLLLIVGLVVALTSPAAAFLLDSVWGAFPTIDKAGSLAFYQSGVQWRLFDSTDPGLRLIGIHVGHLWITAAFDLLVEPFAAMNLQAFANLCLTWAASAALLRALGAEPSVAMLFAAPFGLSLHQFRDIHWYTVEKTSLYWLPLYAWSLARGHRRLPAALLFGAFLVNIYVGLLAALAGALAVAHHRRFLRPVVLSALAVLPLGALQWRLMHGAGSLGDPQTFLTERAALDVVTLWPPTWNRLEGWRAVNVGALLLASLGIALDIRGTRRLGLVFLLALVLALGPTGNPVYLALFEAVPGFWRIAKPETFFHLAYLAALAAAALTVSAFRPSRRNVAFLAATFIVGWIASVRTHPVYPGFAEPRSVSLGADWQRALPGSPSP